MYRLDEYITEGFMLAEILRERSSPNVCQLFLVSMKTWSVPCGGSKVVIYTYITKTRSMSWTFSSDCKVPLPGSLVCPQDTEQGTEDALELSWLGVNAVLAGGVGWALGRQVGRTEFSLASVFESLRHMAPQKPSVVLLAYWSRVWVRLHVFWKPVSLLHTTWFLRWLLLSELAASWQCLKKPALEGGRECLGLDWWLSWLSIFDGFLFGLHYLLMWVLKLALIHVPDTDGLVLIFFQGMHSYEFSYLHECLCSTYVCLVIIRSRSTNKIRNEITSMASEM